MDSLGARFKKSRLEKKLTIDEVYKRTKIHPNVLLAIEEDRFSQFNPVYLKGFLKIYSRFLGMNPQEIIDGYQDTKTRVQAQATDTVKSKPQPVGTSVPKTEKVEAVIKEPIFNFALIKTYLKTAGMIAAAVIALVLVFKAGAFAVGRIKAVAHAIATRPKKEAKPVENKEKVPIKAQAKAKAVEPKTEAKTVVKPATVAVKPVSSLVILAVRAKEDCYIHLKSDGKTVFQGVLKKGFAETWSAKNKMEFTVGNAGGIDVEVNGNLIPPLGKRKQSIKNILITKEGLSTSG